MFLDAESMKNTSMIIVCVWLDTHGLMEHVDSVPKDHHRIPKKQSVSVARTNSSTQIQLSAEIVLLTPN